MKQKRFLLALMISGLLPVSVAMAETPKPAPKDAIEITAEQSLEWYEDQKLYVARGAAKAIKGDMVIEGDILTAHQENTAAPKGKKAAKKENSSSIDRISAEGNVHIKDPRQEVWGDKGVYDLNQGIAQITGPALKYVTDGYTVTAKESLEYYDHDNQAVARGKAVAIDTRNQADKRRIEGNVLSARFEITPENKKELAQLVAEGQVTVVSKGDVSRGDKAVYDVKKDIALMTGNVRITHGTIQLAGDAAEVDFKTGQSRLLNQGTGRVKALMLPSKK